MAGAPHRNSSIARVIQVDRDQLRKLIAEELARALAEEDVAVRPETSSGSGRTAKARRPRSALVVFSGERSPSESMLNLFSSMRRGGWRIEALASRTFREVVLKEQPGGVGDLSLFAAADDEAEVARLVDSVAALVFPDLSENALSKATLGIADSIPTRTMARALTSGAACVLLESVAPPSAVVGLERLEKLRRLARRGAVLAEPGNLSDQLNAALIPAVPEPYEPMSGRNPLSRAVVTADDVVLAARRGQTRLLLPPRAIITDRAREEAKRRGLELIRSEASS